MTDNLTPSFAQQPTASNTATPAPVQPTTPIPPPLPPKPSNERFLPYILAFFAVVTGIILFLIFQQLRRKPETLPQITVIVTPTPTPTPIRIATNISTSSAFLEFNTYVSSLSGKLKDFERNDPSLSPPSLVLPLGFSN